MSAAGRPENRSLDLLWEAWDEPGLEHLALRLDAGEPLADGEMLGVHAGRLVRVHYVIRCDAAWRAREVRVEADALPGRVLDLLADGVGHWRLRGGEPLAALDGCVDVDLYASAFTNTLPMRRLRLEPGDAAEIRVVYIALPTLELAPARQRYTLLSGAPPGAAGATRAWVPTSSRRSARTPTGWCSSTRAWPGGLTPPDPVSSGRGRACRRGRP